MISVALDGPSGAGKSSVAKEVAKQLGFVYMDTGACYRGITLGVLEQGIDPGDEEAVKELLIHTTLELTYPQGEQHLLLNGRDVSQQIRTPQVSEAVSAVSALGSVRQWLLGRQRQMAQEQNVIMDGRDIGTVVLPYATVKIFLTASPEERAKRRQEEYLAKNIKMDYNKVLEDMRRRDQLDSQRELAPLRQAEDAILLDTTGLNFEQVVASVLEIIRGL